jgi:hypothetical protein
MAHNKNPHQSLFSQVVVGVVVSVLTAVTLKGLGLAETGSPLPSAEANLVPRTLDTVRLSFAPVEPLIELPPPEALLFDCHQTAIRRPPTQPIVPAIADQETLP